MSQSKTPTCADCGKPMQFNVPRLGPSGGYVHADTGSPTCSEPENAQKQRDRAMSKTPLTDAARKSTGATPIISPALVYASDCRAIEARLNAAVEALEQMIGYAHIYINGVDAIRGFDGARTDIELAKEAIAGARKPL